jgi:hypothetical protein
VGEGENLCECEGKDYQKWQQIRIILKGFSKGAWTTKGEKRRKFWRKKAQEGTKASAKALPKTQAKARASVKVNGEAKA